MKTASLLLLAAALLLGSLGCARRGVINGNCAQAPETCGQCPPAGAACAGPAPAPNVTGAVAYPYYTLHGPRDFLDRNPRPIGP